MTFSDAIQACRNEGSDVSLASIVDNYEQAYAETLVHYNGDAMLWLGLLDDKVEAHCIQFSLLQIQFSSCRGHAFP